MGVYVAFVFESYGGKIIMVDNSYEEFEERSGTIRIEFKTAEGYQFAGDFFYIASPWIEGVYDAHDPTRAYIDIDTSELEDWEEYLIVFDEPIPYTPSVPTKTFTVQLSKLASGARIIDYDPSVGITLEEGSSITLYIEALEGYRIRLDTDMLPAIFSSKTEIYGDFIDEDDELCFLAYITISYDDISDGESCVIEIRTAKYEPPEEPEEPTDPNARTQFFTVYQPSDEDMIAINNAIFLTSSGSANITQYFSSYKKFFIKIPTNGEKVLKAGKYNFQRNVKVVSQLKQVVDCGTIFIPERYHSVLDYSPYTRIQIYLPFSGFQELNPSEVMNHNIRLQYTVDVLSGRCLAQIYSDITEPESCIANYFGTIAYDVMFGTGGGGEYFYGMYDLLTSMQLGELTPYVLIHTKRPLEGSNTSEYEGTPTSEVIKVGDVTGFVAYETIYASNMIATESEKKEIEQLLRQGVLVD